MEETPFLERSRYLPIKQAVEVLAAICDGAILRDHEGYNGPDAPLGHLLAFLAIDAWPPAAFYTAWVMLRKYRQQLARSGIAYDDLPEPPCLQTHDRFIARLPTGEFLVVFPSHEHLTAAFRKIPGNAVRRHPVRHRLVHEVPGAGKALLEFAERYGFDCTPDVRRDIEQTTAESWISLEEGWFALYFPKDPSTNAEIKAMRGWHSTQPVFHWLIPQREEGMQRLRAFLVRHPKFLLRPEAEQALLTLPREAPLMKGDCVQKVSRDDTTTHSRRIWGNRMISMTTARQSYHHNQSNLDRQILPVLSTGMWRSIRSSSVRMGILRGGLSALSSIPLERSGQPETIAQPN